ncbi:MAG: bifunctional pyr operon transcriptional regulator/uracil phosphoribosyltransferase PyrR [Verrucomicrobiae bacterium]|nr:bifunctional pyr operon transcriptional regulator/uracil phosphoribosyltransferase PyrR [Verrucomicrobiae bacterium]
MTVILHTEAMHRALVRMAHEILEQNEALSKLVLVGLQTRGVYLAKRLAGIIQQSSGQEIITGTLDISLYRDDLHLRRSPPNVKATQMPLTIDGKTVVLVDDVFFTGRSARAAMDALNDFGRPQRIQLAVLVDRGHRELPIRPDYVGKNEVTDRGEKIRVKMKEEDGVDEVAVVKGGGER